MTRFYAILISIIAVTDVWAENAIKLYPDSKGESAKVTLTPYPASRSNNTGIAVIVCPGGSYSWLDIKEEGIGTAQWLQSNGINAFVLRYRVANVSAYILGYRVLGVGNKYPDMLFDIETALKYVYENSNLYNIDTQMIGVMGFSAGGHLAMSSYLYNDTPYKPSFICPIYPVVTMSDNKISHTRSRRGALGVWGQFNKELRDSLSIEKHIDGTCPPVFLVNCRDDKTVKYQNSVVLDSALTANNINHKYIQYGTGGHGFGASDIKGTEESRQWKNEFLLWILNLRQSLK
ncbi:MAG: alpha/beta hydrolase [Paludibacteraceae bacterium]|nr:alpha/beta hydrolase [Paludibacteraceae bacterium]